MPLPIVALLPLVGWLVPAAPTCRPAARPAIVHRCSSVSLGALHKVEVLPPEANPPRMSDETVSSILELVWRDTRKVFREYRAGDLTRTVFHALQGERANNQTLTTLPPMSELIEERLPMLRWWLGYSASRQLLALNGYMSRVSPRAKADRRRESLRLRKQIDERRDTLWPTLRALLLTQNMHRRVVNAAQTQIARSYGTPSTSFGSGALLAPVKRRSVFFSLVSSPRRVLRLWLGLMLAIWHASCWVLNEFGLRWILSPRQRSLVRIALIERAVARGLELQQRVESIEEDAARDASLLALRSA